MQRRTNIAFGTESLVTAAGIITSAARVGGRIEWMVRGERM